MLSTLFLVALAGRFPISRLGVEIPGDARVLGCPVLLAGTLWVHFRYRSGAGVRWTKSTLLMGGLFLFQAVSSLWSPRGAREGVVLDVLVLIVLLVCTLVLITPKPEHAARLFLALSVAAATVFAVAALLSDPDPLGRHSAFGGGPNVFVRVMTMGIISSQILAYLGSSRLVLIPVPLFVAGALLSGSRGGLVAVVLTSLVFFPLLARRFPVRAVALLLLANVAVVLAVGAVVSQTTRSQFEGSDGQGSGKSAEVSEGSEVLGRYTPEALESEQFSYRPMLWSGAWQMFLQHPIFGAGLDAFYAELGRKFEVTYPHNYVLAVAAEQGLVGLLILAILGVSWWREGRPWLGMPMEFFGCAMVASYIGTASMFSGDYYDSRFAWIFAAIVVSRSGRLELADAGTPAHIGGQVPEAR